MLKGIDGVFGELQRRNQLFTQLISREEGRNKEIDGLRAELVNVKKDLVAKQDMGWRRLESELERRLALLERKVSSKPPYVPPPLIHTIPNLNSREKSKKKKKEQRSENSVLIVNNSVAQSI
jgi:hypothetical protein